MKKILLFAVALFLFGTITTQAALVPVNVVYDTVANVVRQIPNAMTAGFNAAFFNATSTTATSTFAGDVTVASNKAIYTGRTQRAITTANSSGPILRVGAGQEFTTIQSAVDKIPYFVDDNYRILIDPGTYNENVLIPEYVAQWIKTPSSTESYPVALFGSSTDPSLVNIKSITSNGAYGAIPLIIEGVTIFGSSEYDNEQSGISIYGGAAEIKNVVFSGGVDGILAYGSRVDLTNVDFGIDVLTRAIRAKHGGVINETIESAEIPSAVSGRVTGHARQVDQGIIFLRASSTLQGSSTFSETLSVANAQNGFVYDTQSGTIYNNTAGLSVFGNVGFGSSSPSRNFIVESDQVNPTYIAGFTAPNMCNGCDSGFSIGKTIGNQEGFTLNYRNHFIDSLRYLSIKPIENALEDGLVVHSSGNIGIGTTTPDSELTVVGGMRLTGSFSDSASSTGSNGMVLQTTSTTTRWVATSSLGITAGGSGTVNSGNTGEIGFFSATGTAIGATSSIFITQTGNIGIRTTSPTNRLQVSTASLGDGITLDSGGTVIGVIGRRTVSGVTIGMGIDGASGRPVSIAGNTNTDVLLAAAGGRVGINTTVPSTTLHVVGSTTLATTSITALSDITGSIGSNGNVLLSTGTSTRWVATSSLGISGGGFSDPLTTNGDIIARISGATTRLAQGGNGTFLGVSGGVLGYYTPTGGSGGGSLATTTDIIGDGGVQEVSYVQGDVMFGGSSSTTAEFQFDDDGGKFIISTSSANATATIESNNNAQAVRIGDDNGSGIENFFGRIGDAVLRMYGAVTRYVFQTANGTDIFTVGAATTTAQHGSPLSGFLQATIARIFVGDEVGDGYNKMGTSTSPGALTVNGLFFQESFNQIDCSSIVGATQIAADGVTGCDGLAFYEDNTSTLTATNNGGNIYSRLSTSAITDGAGVFLNAPTAGALFLATSTPVIEVTARLHTVQNQGTTTETFIGFTNIASAGTTYETRPTAGCFFTASTTQANWRAICQTAAGAATNVNTGIASSTVTTGNGAPYRFLIETGTSSAKFYIQSTEAGALTLVANITTNVPNTTALNAGVHFGRISSATAVGVDVYDMNIGWRKVLAR